MLRLSIPLLVVSLFLGAADVSAQKIGRAEIKDAIFKLKSPNPDEVISSVTLLAASGSSQAVGPLTDLLRTGPRNDITDAVIQALGSIRSKASISILLEYLDHRRPQARIAALFALQGFDDPKIVPALESKLRDSDPGVRSNAALALGKKNSKSSVPILFQALDRGVYDAVVSIGQVGTPEDAQRLAGYLGKVDIKILLPGFDEFLKRKSFPKKAKMAILDELLEKAAGPDVKKFAIAYKATFPEGTDEDTNPLYKKVSRMVRQIAD